jgi:TRAP-type uncharacterized transport system fused permease subunit
MVPTPGDLAMGLIAIVLLLELSCRIVDNTFTGVVVFFLLYTLLAIIFQHPGAQRLRSDRIVGHMYMTLEGIFGVPLEVSVSFVICLSSMAPSWMRPARGSSGWNWRWP